MKFSPLYILLTVSISCLTFANLVSADVQDSKLNLKDKHTGSSLAGIHPVASDPRDKRMITTKAAAISLSDRMKKAQQNKLNASASEGNLTRRDRKANAAQKIFLRAAQSKRLGSFSGSASLGDAGLSDALSKRNIQKHPTDENKLSLTNMDYLDGTNPGPKPPKPGPSPITGGMLSTIDPDNPSHKRMVDKAEQALTRFEELMTLGKGDSCSPEWTSDLGTIVEYFGNLGVNFTLKSKELNIYLAKVDNITSSGEPLCDYRNLQKCDTKTSICSYFDGVVSEETSGKKTLLRLAAGYLCFNFPEIYDTRFEVLCTQKAIGTCSRSNPAVCTCRDLEYGGDLCDEPGGGGGSGTDGNPEVGATYSPGHGGHGVHGGHKGLGTPCQDDKDCDFNDHLECQGGIASMQVFFVDVKLPEYFLGPVGKVAEVGGRPGRSIDSPEPHPPKPRKTGRRRYRKVYPADEPILEENNAEKRPRDQQYTKGPGYCGCTKGYAPTWFYVDGVVYSTGCGKSVGESCEYPSVRGPHTRECASHRCSRSPRNDGTLVCTRSFAGLLFIPSIYRTSVEPYQRDKPDLGVSHSILSRSVSGKVSRSVSAGTSRKDAFMTILILNILLVVNPLSILDA